MSALSADLPFLLQEMSKRTDKMGKIKFFIRVSILIEV
jgi:hypothetical protein